MGSRIPFLAHMGPQHSLPMVCPGDTGCIQGNYRPGGSTCHHLKYTRNQSVGHEITQQMFVDLPASPDFTAPYLRRGPFHLKKPVDGWVSQLDKLL